MSKQLQRKFASPVSADLLAGQAEEALRREKFKDAIELLKQLVKREARPEWRNALADAYLGRAKALAAKGMFKEAEIVLGNAAAVRRHRQGAAVSSPLPGPPGPVSKGARACLEICRRRGLPRKRRTGAARGDRRSVPRFSGRPRGFRIRPVRARNIYRRGHRRTRRPERLDRGKTRGRSRSAPRQDTHRDPRSERCG